MQFRYKNLGRDIDVLVELPAANVKAIDDFIQQQRELILRYKRFDNELHWTPANIAQAGMAIASRQPDAAIWQDVTDNNIRAALYAYRQQAIAKV